MPRSVATPTVFLTSLAALLTLETRSACALASEVVTLHTTGKTFTAAHCSDVDALADCQCVDGNFLSDSKTINRIETKLDEARAALDCALAIARTPAERRHIQARLAADMDAAAKPAG